MQKTDNYELNLPEAEDFFNVEDFNDNTKKVDEVLESLENPEHDTGKQAEVEELASGESLKVALRKLAKAVKDLISHLADKVVHITSNERTLWNTVSNKADSNHTHKYAGSSSAGGAATTALECTGNSATATKLQTARKINGVAFDGSTDITTSCGKYSKVLSNRVKGAGWYRIACKTPSPQYVGTLTLVRRWSSDTPEAYTILISQMGPSYNFAQLLGTGVQSIKKVRILRSTSNPYNSQMYFDIYIDNATNNNPVSAQFNNLQDARFDVDDYMLPDLNTLMAPVEIPEGYVSEEFELSNNYGSYFKVSKIDELTVGSISGVNYAGSSSAGGSANSAKKLSSTRYIDGIPFDGSSNLSRLGTCATASYDTAKKVTIGAFDGEGASDAILYIQFTGTYNGGANDTHTISINDGEQLVIYYQGAVFKWETFFSNYPFCDGQIHQFRYFWSPTGSYLELIAPQNRAVANNLTTTNEKIALAAPMGKQLAETDASLQEQISTLNSNKVSVSVASGATVSTGINVNAGSRGKTYLVMASGNSNTGNASVSEIGMIRCGYDGNNYSYTNIAFSGGTSTANAFLQFSVKDGILYVGANFAVTMRVTFIVN